MALLMLKSFLGLIHFSSCHMVFVKKGFRTTLTSFLILGISQFLLL